MDIKEIRKNLKKSIDSKISDEHQATVKKSIQEALKQRDNEIKQLISIDEKTRSNQQTQRINQYNKKKEDEYNKVLESLKRKFPTQYNYYKEYEKKHGWKKTTQLLEKKQLMKKWINFTEKNYTKLRKLPKKTSTKKEIEDLSKPSPHLSKSAKPPIEIGELKPPQPLYEKINELEKRNPYKQAEHDYIKEKAIDNSEIFEAAEYLKYRFKKARFTEEEIKHVLNQLTFYEIVEIANKLKEQEAIDEYTENYGSKKDIEEVESPQSIEEKEDDEFTIIIRLLSEYGVFL